MDDQIRNFAKNKTGIERIYKSFDLRKIDVNGTNYIKPDVKLNDMLESVAQKALESSGKAVASKSYYRIAAVHLHSGVRIPYLADFMSNALV